MRLFVSILVICICSPVFASGDILTPFGGLKWRSPPWEVVDVLRRHGAMEILVPIIKGAGDERMNFAEAKTLEKIKRKFSDYTIDKDEILSFSLYQCRGVDANDKNQVMDCYDKLYRDFNRQEALLKGYPRDYTPELQTYKGNDEFVDKCYAGVSIPGDYDKPLINYNGKIVGRPMAIKSIQFKVMVEYETRSDWMATEDGYLPLKGCYFNHPIKKFQIVSTLDSLTEDQQRTLLKTFYESYKERVDSGSIVMKFASRKSIELKVYDWAFEQELAEISKKYKKEYKIEFVRKSLERKRKPWANYTLEDDYRNRIDFQVSEKGCSIIYILGSRFGKDQEDRYKKKLNEYEVTHAKKQEDASSSL